MDAASKTTRLWTMVTEMMVSSPEMFEISPVGEVGLTEAGRKESEPAFRTFLTKEPPEWVKAMAKQQLRLSTALANVEQQKAQAKESAAELADIVARAGPTLTPEQEIIAHVAKQAIRQHGFPPSGIER